MHYYKFNVASWAKDTGHLSLKEEAIYLRLINYYYDNEKKIPLKTQLVLRKLRMADESETVDLILEEFFVRSKDGWHHHHCDKLIKEYQSRAERNRENGKSGGRPKINELDKATGLIVGNDTEPTGNLNYKPLTTNEELKTKEPETKEKTIDPDIDFKASKFEEFYDLYAKKRGRAECMKKFMKLKVEEINKILDVVPAYVASTPDSQFRKDPSTWLNQKCWEDEFVTTIPKRIAREGYYIDQNGREQPEWMRGIKR
jgi:uncharacterized protein YdaU (DUF1376 family)